MNLAGDMWVLEVLLGVQRCFVKNQGQRCGSRKNTCEQSLGLVIPFQLNVSCSGVENNHLLALPAQPQPIFFPSLIALQGSFYELLFW